MSLQTRSSAVRLGTLNVYVPNGTANSPQNRMNHAWWYGGTFSSIDNFFFWRPDANDNEEYRKDEDGQLQTQNDSKPSTTWGNPPVVSSSTSLDSDISSSWTFDSDSASSISNDSDAAQSWSSDSNEIDPFAGQNPSSNTFLGNNASQSSISNDSDSSGNLNKDEQIFDRN